MIWVFSVGVLAILAWIMFQRMKRFGAGMNAVLGAATYRTLTKEQRNKVDETLAQFCIDNNLDPARLSTTPKPNVDLYPAAAVYAWRAEAMKQMGIKPADPAYPHFMVTPNPFLAILAGSQIRTGRIVVETHLGILLTELD